MMLSYSSQARCKPSEYHQGCVPAEVRKMAEVSQANLAKPLTESEVAKLNVVAQDAIWTERVVQEKQGAQSWEENWGFMAEFDPKGNVKEGQPKPDRELPSRVNMYSEGVPNTNAGNYGARVETDMGKHILDLELRFFPGYRKTKLGSDMVCY